MKTVPRKHINHPTSRARAKIPRNRQSKQEDQPALPIFPPFRNFSSDFSSSVVPGCMRGHYQLSGSSARPVNTHPIAISSARGLANSMDRAQRGCETTRARAKYIRASGHAGAIATGLYGARPLGTVSKGYRSTERRRINQSD